MVVILGVKVGVQLEISITLISADIASVGLTAEAGVYGKFYGYFYYELHMINGEKNSNAKGAMYIDFGAYLEIKFKAALFNSDKLTYNPTLLDKEWPILSFGESSNVLDFATAQSDTGTITLKRTAGIAMRTRCLP